jgi:hypothetical protein
MKTTTLSALGVGTLLLALLGVTPAPTPVPNAKPNFTSMMFMTGTWECHQMLRGKDRPDTSVTTIGGDGAYMVTQDTAPPFDKYRTFSVKSTSYLTYDPTIKKWVAVGIDSTGGYFLASSPGWNGNTMSSTSKGLDGSVFADTLTKVSETETIDRATATDPKGKVTKSVVTCKKTGA